MVYFAQLNRLSVLVVATGATNHENNDEIEAISKVTKERALVNDCVATL